MKVVFGLLRRLYELCEWVLSVWPHGARWTNSSVLHEQIRADHDQLAVNLFETFHIIVR